MSDELTPGQAAEVDRVAKLLFYATFAHQCIDGKSADEYWEDTSLGIQGNYLVRAEYILTDNAVIPRADLQALRDELATMTAREAEIRRHLEMFREDVKITHQLYQLFADGGADTPDHDALHDRYSAHRGKNGHPYNAEITALGVAISYVAERAEVAQQVAADMRRAATEARSREKALADALSALTDAASAWEAAIVSQSDENVEKMSEAYFAAKRVLTPRKEIRRVGTASVMNRQHRFGPNMPWEDD